MASGSSQEQMPIAQVGALNTICQQFADSDKKTLKRKVTCLKQRVTELDKQRCSDRAWSRDMKLFYEDAMVQDIVQVEEVLKKGTETGLTLSAEEVQKLCVHLDNARDSLEDPNVDSL